MMTHELSYKQIKTAHDVRTNEELRHEQRKRNLLLLILHYLEEQGYLDSVSSLENEAGVSLKKFEICDNVDLETILQEYESYFYVKFNKWPKITKRAKSEENGRAKQPSSSKKPSFTKKKSDFALPDISSPTHQQSASSSPSPSVKSSSAKQRSHSGNELKKPSKSAKPFSSNKQDVNSFQGCPSDEGISLSGSSLVHKENKQPTQNGARHGKKTVIDFKAILSNTLKGECIADVGPDEKLLKPLAGYAGLTGEYRDLAAVVTRDIYLENPNVRWSDIIGLNEAKRLIKESVVYPIKYPQLFTGILSPWKGLLLYGPPGTGKTLLAKAVATECNTTFFNISASTVVSKWRGDSEKLIRVLFDLARFHAPSTIFLDELDSLMGQRGSSGASGEHEGSRRMKTELLVQMDGLSKTEDLVFLLAASNLPWELDHAMLRRLEKRILVCLPTLEARLGILKHFLPPERNSEYDSSLSTNIIDYDTIAERTEGYSGSDLRLLCKEAAMRPLRKIFDVLEDLSPDESSTPCLQMEQVTTNDMEEALKRTKPSANTIKEKYEKWKNEFESV